MAEGLGLDVLQRIINVRWSTSLAFLYSGADGMFGSKDGQEWEKLTQGAVPAEGLAWVDGVWMAIGEVGTWRSVDGGKTWNEGAAGTGLDFQQIVACKPKPGTKQEDNETDMPGIFAGWLEDAETGNAMVYLSMDLGETFSLALEVPSSIPFGDNENGFEFGIILSGCGNGIFLSTIYGPHSYASGDGCVYVSLDGGGFGGRQVVWPGTSDYFPYPDFVPQTYSNGYTAGAVGYDSETDQFCLIGHQTESHSVGLGGFLGANTDARIIYATGTGGSFGGGGILISRYTPALSRQLKILALGSGAAGGGGEFVATYVDEYWPDFYSGGTGLQGKLTASFVPGGGDVLISVPSMFDTTGRAQCGPVVWKSDKAEAGTFACIAFGTDSGPGGVWINSSGTGSPEGGGSSTIDPSEPSLPPMGWTKTHSGEGFTGEFRAGLGVGKLSWLGSQQGI